MTTQPARAVILKNMIKDPVAWLNIITTAVFMYFAVSNIPKGYPNIVILYVLGILLLGFSVYVRYELSRTRILVSEKQKKMDDILKSLNLLMKKAKLLNQPKKGLMEDFED